MQSQRDFFYAVLSGEGMPCLAYPTSKGKFVHVVYDSIEDFCAAIEKLKLDNNNYYFCISTLAQKSIDLPHGDSVKRRVRVQRNMLRSRVFVLDIDIRPDKEGFYSTLDEAKEGVQAVVEAFQLPQPILVNSGFGLHVYWPMAEGIDSPRWQRVAGKFKRAISLIVPEVVADGSRVSDSAGVLRIPYSYNLKSTPPKPVEIIQWFSDMLDFGEFNRTLSRATGVSEDSTPVADVDLTLKRGELEPVDIRAVAKRCNWVRDYLKHKNTASEPEWYAMLGLVPYMYLKKNDNEVTGPRLANILSKGHEGYSEDATNQKYEQAFHAQTGPTTCERLESITPERCRGCPFYKAVKTPIQTAKLDIPITTEQTVETTTKTELGDEIQETITIPVPPKPYFRGENGGVYVRRKEKNDDTGDWDVTIKKVYDYDMYPTRRVRNESSENELMEIHLWLPKDGLRKFKLSNGLLADNKALKKFLSEKGIVSEHGSGQGITRYLVDYVRHMQMSKAAEIEFSRFGWRDINTADPKFIVGDGYFSKDASFHPSSFAPYLRDASRALLPQGSLELWKQGFNMYSRIPDSYPLIFTAMMGFAAPLMALTEYSGVLVNMTGHSAAGKSTALKVMTSIWGTPNPQHMLAVDTNNAIFNFIGYLSNIPVAFDEVTKLDDDRVSDFVLNFTSGRGKMRANRAGQNVDNEVFWDTIVVASSNTSLYNKVTSARRGYNAEAMRIYEMNVKPSDPKYKGMVDQSIRLLRDNYGIAGREYIKYIIPRTQKIREQIEKAMNLIAVKMHLRNEERFWCALVACVYVGGLIAQKALGLHNYDMQWLLSRAMEESDDVRAAVEAAQPGPVSTLAEFINANLDAILRIQDDNVDLSAMSGSMRRIVARLEYTDKGAYGYFSVSAIRTYCQRNNIDNAWLRRELIEKGIVVKDSVQKRLTAGTKLPVVNTRCWQIDLKNKELSERID